MNHNFVVCGTWGRIISGLKGCQDPDPSADCALANVLCGTGFQHKKKIIKAILEYKHSKMEAIGLHAMLFPSFFLLWDVKYLGIVRLTKDCVMCGVCNL